MPKKRLDSWKAIAEFLGRSLRTVQRWHDLNGLPVHHFGGHKGSVFAYEDEIDRWLVGLAENPGQAQLRVDETFASGKRSSIELSSTADSMWGTRSVRNIQTVADLYRKAIDNDPGNTAAFTGLANAMIYCALTEMMDGSIAYPSAVEALRWVPQQGPDNLDAKCAKAWIEMLYNRNWLQSRAGFEDVLRKRPVSFAWSGLAVIDVAEGRLLEAVECAWEAWRLNPLVRSLGALLCWIMYLGGDYQKALDLISQVRIGGGDDSMLTSVEALILVQSGRLTANLGLLEKAAFNLPKNRTLHGILGCAYGILGEEGKARQKLAFLTQLSETGRKSNGYALALAFMGLNDEQEAISGLEASYAEGSLWCLGFRSDPILRRFEREPRFERMVGKIGAPRPLPATSGLQDREVHSYQGRVLVGGTL